MEEIKRVDQINGELIKSNSPSIEEQWKRHSIYKVPSRVTELNKKAFRPHAVSFGPYHYGEESLKGMEEHKHRALLHFLKRCKKPIEFLFQRMEQVVEELRDSYKPLDPIWTQDTPRKSLIQHGPTHPTPIPKAQFLPLEHGDDIIRSARELHEVGVRFKKSKTQSLRDVSFDCGVLRLPTIIVDDTTEYMLLNLIAFECLHVGAGNEVTSYVFFMSTIIDNIMDVALLNRRGILINVLGSDKDVAKLFNSLCKDITVDHQGVLDEVKMSLSNYCKKPWNKCKSHSNLL
ncbi:hypothetical protein SESBI_40819 [Sesbania bispinosa]|nr:hypothetical protein SESBI_40819 [Sesbania bispinosa]